MGSGRLLITVQEAVQIARKHMRKWDGTELPAEVDVKLEKGDYVVLWGLGCSAYINSGTGEVMYPRHDIRYDPHLG